MDKKKKYGNVTVKHLHYIVECISALEKFKTEIPELFRNTPEDKKNKILGTNFSWVRLYRFPFYRNLMGFLFISGFASIAKRIIKKKPDDPTEEVIEAFNAIPKFKGGPLGLFKEKHLLESAYPVIKSANAICLYATTVNRLLKRAEQGYDGAFFHAVRVDRSVVSYKGMTARIAKAEMEGDEEFFKRLRNALTAKVGNLDDYAMLRYILAVLHESKALDNLTQKEAYELLAKELRLYPQTGENPASSLWQYIERWKKEVDIDIKK